MLRWDFVFHVCSTGFVQHSRARAARTPGSHPFVLHRGMRLTHAAYQINCYSAPAGWMLDTGVSATPQLVFSNSQASWSRRLRKR